MTDGNQEAFHERINKDFLTWLINPKGNGMLREMIANGDDRLSVDLSDLEAAIGHSRQRILDEPHRYMPPLEEALLAALKKDDKDFGKNVKAPRPVLALHGTFGRHHVTPRGLTAELLSKMVCIDGIVTRVTNVQPKIVVSVNYCKAEKNVFVVETPDQMGYTTPMNPQRACPKTTAQGNPYEPELGMSVYRDTQRITLQEMPERAPTGLLPRAVEVLLEGNLVNKARPGERLRVCALYKPFLRLPSEGPLVRVTNGVVKSLLVANRVESLKKEATMDIDPADLKNIRKIIEREDTLELCARSFAPSICGHSLVKRGLILQLLGGREKSLENGTHLRGDIHALLIGDPSCGKSQLLRFVLNLAPLAVSTTGRGSSGVGLTASVITAKGSRERSLEAGAMVLADRGVVCIDEFDKMTTQDRTAIHEVMEQQTVTIAKAGMHVQLNARCSVVAAANPIYGTWDVSEDMSKNIHLPDSLLSRFDLIFIVKDLTEPEEDRRIARQVLRQLRYRGTGVIERSGVASEFVEPEAPSRDSDDPTEVFIRANLYDGKEVLTTDFLRKLMHYCKGRAEPDLNSAAVQSLAEFYRDLRQKWDDKSRTLPVTTRLLESAIRIATAHAKLKLRPEVLLEDVEVAKNLILETRNEKLEAEIPVAPIAADGVAPPVPPPVAPPAPRDSDFDLAFAKVLEKKQAGFSVLDVATLVNAELRPGAVPFAEEEARAQLDRVVAAERCIEIEGQVFPN